LAEFLESAPAFEKLKPNHQIMFFQMLERNIFTQDPSVLASELRNDYTVMIIEPSWLHLSYCFQMLNKFAQIFPNSDALSFSVAKSAIYLTQLPDVNERSHLTSFLRIYVDTHPGERGLFVSELTHQLIELLDGVALPFCGASLVTLFGHIASKVSSPLPPEYLQLFVRGILPLFGSPHLSLFVKNLKLMLQVMLPAHPQLLPPSIRAFERYWAHTDCRKQHFFLDILVSLCARLPQPMLDQFSKRLFKFLGTCLASTNSKIIEGVLDIWVKNSSGDWIWTNAKIAIPELIDGVTLISEKFWSKMISDKATVALGEMAKIDKATFHKLKQAQKQAKAQRFQRTFIANDCQRQWVDVEEAARHRYPEIDYRPLRHLIRDLFHNEKPEMLAPTRFGPMVRQEVQPRPR
jgi:hypothetical protein